jgi:hypothetical protein
MMLISFPRHQFINGLGPYPGQGVLYAHGLPSPRPSVAPWELILKSVFTECYANAVGTNPER